MSLKPFKPRGMWLLDQQIENSGNKQRGFGSGVSNDCTLFHTHKITFFKFKLIVQCQPEKFLLKAILSWIFCAQELIFLSID